MHKVLSVLTISLFAVTSSISAVTCQGPFNGKSLTRVEIEDLLSKTKLETSLDEPSSILNLCGANLSGVNLSNLNLPSINLNNADLSNCDLSKSNLQSAKLNGADLTNAKLNLTYLRWARLERANLNDTVINNADFSDTNLQKASFNASVGTNVTFTDANLEKVISKASRFTNSDFSYANMQSSDFRYSDLSNSNVSHVNLQNSYLSNTNLLNTNLSSSKLSNATLSFSNLTKANLKDTKIKETVFLKANLDKAKFMHQYNSLPDIISLASSKNFATIDFYQSDLGAPQMINLRSAYNKAGMRFMERQITSMIKKQEMMAGFSDGLFGIIKSSFAYIFFYLTCDFGLKTNLPLILFAGLILLMAIPYYLAKKLNNSKHNIVVKTNDNDEFNPGNLKSSLYFSLLSSTDIGWEDFNISNFIKRLQHSEYKLIGTGIIRQIAGLQSLIGFYLIVLWIVCTFGQPFRW